MERQQALAALGLDENFTADTLQTAYERLKQLMASEEEIQRLEEAKDCLAQSLERQTLLLSLDATRTIMEHLPLPPVGTRPNSASIAMGTIPLLPLPPPALPLPRFAPRTMVPPPPYPTRPTQPLPVYQDQRRLNQSNLATIPSIQSDFNTKVQNWIDRAISSGSSEVINTSIPASVIRDDTTTYATAVNPTPAAETIELGGGVGRGRGGRTHNWRFSHGRFGARGPRRGNPLRVTQAQQTPPIQEMPLPPVVMPPPFQVTQAQQTPPIQEIPLPPVVMPPPLEVESCKTEEHEMIKALWDFP